jgi:hypothetical protein
MLLKAKGANGFVNEIMYLRENYVAYSILKSSLDPESDNLLFEYLVGQYLNKKGKIFSCFLETYGIFRYNNPESHSRFQQKETYNIDLKTSLLPMSETDSNIYAYSCLYSLYLCVLIQHIKGTNSLKKTLMNEISVKTIGAFINKELLYILYQIYMPLAMLVNEYTHYDLHDDNVLLYRPVKFGHIKYHYHLQDGSESTFNSKYLVKIIDYGRCYFNDGPANNALNIYNKLCETRECDETEEEEDEREEYNKHEGTNIGPENCGQHKGYSILAKEKQPGSFHYISSQIPNKSHDLRLLNIINNLVNRLSAQIPMNLNNEFLAFFRSIVYVQDYGTPARDSNNSGSIYNVVDAYNKLNLLVNNSENKIANNIRYPEKKKIGDLHIYADGRPMEFEPVKINVDRGIPPPPKAFPPSSPFITRPRMTKEELEFSP